MIQHAICIVLKAGLVNTHKRLPCFTALHELNTLFSVSPIYLTALGSKEDLSVSCYYIHAAIPVSPIFERGVIMQSS